MPEDQEAQHWFVLLNNKRYGPYTLPALVKGVEKGVIDRGAGVWRPGWEQWRDASDVPELFAPELLAPELLAPELLAPEPDAVEEPVETEAKVEAPPVSSDAPEETEEKPEPKPQSVPAEPVATEAAPEVQADAVEPAEAALDPAAIVPAIPEPAAVVSEPAIAVPEPALVDYAPANVDAKDSGPDSPREVRESRRNRFRDGPDLFGRGFARSDPVKLEPIKSDRPDRAKPDAAKPEIAKPEIAKPEVGKYGVGKREKLDFSNLDFGAPPRRAGGRDPASRDLLARAIPSELGAPDIGSRNPPLTDAALRVRLNTMLASPDLAAPGKEGAEGPGEGQADAEQAAEPAPDPVATKPLIAVERLSDVASAARNRRADVAPERETPKLTPGAPPLPVPAPEPKGARRGGFLAAILPVVATLIAVGAVAWAASALGIIRVEFLPKPSGGPMAALQSLPGASSVVRPHATLDGLPDIVANMPAVIALKMVDPDAYARFVKRFTAVYRDREADDEILTQARTALRKSIKHLLANATNESLLEVTEVNLAYMRGLTSGNAGSCVALSDESKGAVLDSNLARDFPMLFEREMAVMERVIANAGAKQTAPTEAEVRPYLEAVFTDLKKKPVQMQLLGHDKLTEAEYAPYCNLVIAFYEGVRTLPFNDAVKLLRNLYTAAAAEPDKI